jgi:hypothetical protein
MTSRLRQDDGWAVVIAIVVMAMMITIGFAAIAFVNGETRSSGRERTQEARLNLTEGVLSAELFQLSKSWPSAALADCTQASTSSSCPSPSQLNAHFTGAVDFKLNPTWTIQVRDNVTNGGSCDQPVTPGFYDDATILAQAHYDANKDCQVWVRAEGQLNGKKRVVVAQVRVENRPVNFPVGPFVAGYFQTADNSSSKVIVNGSGWSGVVRCDPATSPEPCINFTSGQLSSPGSVSSDLNAGSTALDPAMVDALRQMAKDRGTYYANSCPADPSGDIVFVEKGDCAYQTGTVNASKKKGIFLINSGTLKITGNIEWWGAIYAANAQGCGPSAQPDCLQNRGQNDVVVDMSGTGTIHGGIYIDGDGRLSVGASGNAGNGNLPNLVYDPTVFSDLRAYGTAGIIQNTWRELTNG